MAADSPLRRAVDTAWNVYLAAHPDVDAADGRRCRWSAICTNGGTRAKAMPKNSHVLGSLISNGLKTNGKTSSNDY